MGPARSTGRKETFEWERKLLSERDLEFWKSSHGEGAPDGIGAALKRSEDNLISHDQDIHNAYELFKALSQMDTSIKLYFIEDDAV